MIDWSHTALVFPGQGSQVIGMGKDFADAFPVSKEIFQQADEILGFALSDLCFNGPEEDLNITTNTQPATYVCSIAILRALRECFPDVKPGFAAGHSLGELTALTAAAALDFEEGVRLVRERGRLMHEADTRNPGGMAALLGLDVEVVREICEKAAAQTGQIIVIANDNCPGQIVISGHGESLALALKLAEEAGVKRAVKLPISIAAHSPLMQSVADEFQRALDNTTFHTPQIPVYVNATAAPLTDMIEIRKRLAGQLTHPVRWTESIQAMVVDGAQTFIEIGSGDVLTGLIKRIERSSTRIALNSVERLQGLTIAT